VEKLFPTPRHVVLESMSKDSNNSNSNNFHDHCYTKEQETFLTYVSSPSVSNEMDKAIQATFQTQVCKFLV